MHIFHSKQHRITIIMLVDPATPNIIFPNPGKYQKDVRFSDVLN